jgi:energy-coupling factor transport system substrate-specific component
MTRIFTALLSLSFFFWPFIISAENAKQANVAQAIFMVLMPVLVALLLTEFSSGKIDSRQLAVLGVLIALNSVIRLLGAGTAGIETIFFLILIGAYVFGPGFGYLLGAGSLAVSALISSGVGPWLPFQMMAAGLIGLVTGFLPRATNRSLQVVTLVVAGVVASFFYGSLMTLWNWPYLAGTGTSISYVPGASFTENLSHYFTYLIFTGGLFWDLGRAVTTAILLTLIAPALLTTLSRAARRAGIRTDN